MAMKKNVMTGEFFVLRCLSDFNGTGKRKRNIVDVSERPFLP